MIVLGLTGSIGMGKSTTAAMFEALGAPVYDADAAVHALSGAGGGAGGGGAAVFRGVRGPAGPIDRTALAARVVGDPEALKRLEGAVHPLVGAHRAAFFAEVAHAAVVVVDVPLLFETGGERSVDAVAVVSAPSDMQRARVLARPSMTPEKLDAILARQLPDAEKRRRADFVIDTGRGLEAARARAAEVLARLRDADFRGRRAET